MKKFNLSGRRQFKKEPVIANQKLKTDVNRGVCYPRLLDFFGGGGFFLGGGSNVCGVVRIKETIGFRSSQKKQASL